MNAEELCARVEQQKQAALNGQRRKGQQATNKASRWALEYQLATLRSSAAPPGYRFRSSVIAFSYPPSMAQLADLKPIDISNLLLETHHRGRVLVVRTLTSPVRIQSVQNVIEDAMGNVDRLSLYNEDPDLKPEQLLPEGAVLAIKEPFYKTTADGGYIIRVDHPSDLVFLQPTNDLVPERFAPRLIYLKSAAEWKTEGNTALSKRDNVGALELYSSGIVALEPGDMTLKCDLLRNRAAVNLLLERFEHAQADAEGSIVPATEPNADRYNTKAYYRAGRAAYKLGKFAEADVFFTSALKISPDDQDTINEQKRNAERQQEEKVGLYKFTQISNSVSKQHRRLDHADFTRNTEVLQAGNKGRGLFATKDIAVGELILCEKAFSVAFAHQDTNDLYIMINLNTNRGFMGPHATLHYNIIKKLRYNPGQASHFLALYDGGYTPKSTAEQVDGGTVIDIFQVQAIIERNCFGCADMRSADGSGTGSDDLGSVGVWLRASYINHSCNGNARRAFIGDLMIVHASKKIAKGEEILMPYKLPDADNDKTLGDLRKTWGFKCDCTICAADAKTTFAQHAQRRKLVKEATDYMAAHKQTARTFPTFATIAKAEQLYRKIDETYNKNIFQGVPRLGLLSLSNWLCQAYSTPATPQKGLDNAMRALRNLGFGMSIRGRSLNIDWTAGFMDGTVTDIAVYAAHIYFFRNDVVLGEQFEAFAKETYRMHNGDLRGFEKRYGNAATRSGGL